MWIWCRWKIGTNQITAVQRVGVREISGHLKGEKGEGFSRMKERRGEERTEDYGSQSPDPQIILSVYWALCAVRQWPVWDIKFVSASVCRSLNVQKTLRNVWSLLFQSWRCLVTSFSLCFSGPTHTHTRTHTHTVAGAFIPSALISKAGWELRARMWSAKHLLLSMLHVLIWVLPWLHKIEGQEVSDVAGEYRMDVSLLHGDRETCSGTYYDPRKSADEDQEGNHQPKPAKWEEEEVYREYNKGKISFPHFSQHCFSFSYAFRRKQYILPLCIYVLPFFLDLYKRRGWTCGKIMAKTLQEQ